MRRKINRNIKLPRDREERVMKEIRDNTDNVLAKIGGLDISEDDKDYLCETIEETANYAIAMFSVRSMPKRGLPYPWDENEMS